MNLASRIRLRLKFELPRQQRLVADAACVCLLFFGTHAAYRASTGHVQNCDSVYSLIVGEKLLTTGSVNLADNFQKDLPYQLMRRGDPPAVYYGYPLGSTFLSLPFIEYAKVRRGTSLLNSGIANTAAENALQLKIAAIVCAAIIVLFYVLCRFYCSPLASVLIAAGFAFGSPVWSTLSRSMWSHTWMVALLSAALVLLVGRRRLAIATARTDIACGIALGTLMFAMLFTRMHGIFSAAGIGVYLLLHHRRMLVATVLTGAAWSALLVAISWHEFGTLVPPSVYSAGTIDRQDVAYRFAALMVSPSRGLLIYCPYLLVVIGILVSSSVAQTLLPVPVSLAQARMPVPPERRARLLLPAAISIASHTLLLSCYNGWHMGSSYGPRYFADLLPWFVLLTAMAVRGIQEGIASPWRRKIAIALLTIAFGWGVFVHARGANAVQAWLWNARAIAMPYEEAVMDWRHPQFLAGITFRVRMDGSFVE
jgi:hypothetical protein